MESENKYEYMADSPINDLLICEICKNPLDDPISTPCHHTFCRQCIMKWLERTLSCPACRNQLLVNELKPADRIVIRMLGQLKVKCTGCGQINLERDNFNDHIEKTCTNSTVSCPSAGIKCPWKGPRDQLNGHIAMCTFEALRPMLSRIIEENRQLKGEVQQLKANSQRERNIPTQLGATSTNSTNLTGSFYNGNQNFRETIDSSEHCSELNLNNNHLLDRDLEYVVQQVINKQCRKLCLSLNEISSEGVSVLANAVCNAPRLEELYLDYNRISDMGVQLLAQTISNNNTNLKVLYLGSNSITHDGAYHLAAMLKRNKTLCRLNLSGNNIGVQGIQFLADALNYHNRSLLQLDLNSNKLENDSTIDSLINMLQNNRSLEQLRMCDCGLSETSKKRLRDAANIKQYFSLRI